jgi:hypothetical protein
LHLDEDIRTLYSRNFISTASHFGGQFYEGQSSWETEEMALDRTTCKTQKREGFAELAKKFHQNIRITVETYDNHLPFLHVNICR